MMTKDEYTAALRLAQSYTNVKPTPDSRYGLRLTELLEQIEQYEAEHQTLSGIVCWSRAFRGVS